jgi:hypothetical protein
MKLPRVRQSRRELAGVRGAGSDQGIFLSVVAWDLSVVEVIVPHRFHASRQVQ